MHIRIGAGAPFATIAAGAEMFAAPPLLETEIHALLPEALHRTGKPSHFVTRRGGGPLHSFLEGPSFDRDGNLYCVDVAHARIFRIAPDGAWSVFAEYEGEPNGLKLHRDGRIFVADQEHGVLCFDPKTAARTTILGRSDIAGFKGLNDLTFAQNGDLYFTDQGQTAIEDPTGRVFRLRATGELDLLLDGLEGPNGLVLNLEENILYVAVTRKNRVLALPLVANCGGVAKAGLFIQLSGGLAGPDGMALDRDGNLIVVHAGFGTVWVFSRFGEPLFRIRSCTGIRTTNVAFGSHDENILYITEAERGAILKVNLPVPGVRTYGLS
jgi:gluconolactonase